MHKCIIYKAAVRYSVLMHLIQLDGSRLRYLLFFNVTQPPAQMTAQRKSLLGDAIFNKTPNMFLP